MIESDTRLGGGDHVTKELTLFCVWSSFRSGHQAGTRFAVSAEDEDPVPVETGNEGKQDAVPLP